MPKRLTPMELIVQRADPAVFEKVRLLERLYPQLNGRALRAGLLVVRGAVHHRTKDPKVWRVNSESGYDHYEIHILDWDGSLRHATCDCPDYQFARHTPRRTNPAPQLNGGGPKCKHLCAVAIVRAIEKDKKRTSVKEGTKAEAQAAKCGFNQSSHGSTPSPAAQPRTEEQAIVAPEMVAP